MLDKLPTHCPNCGHYFVSSRHEIKGFYDHDYAIAIHPQKELILRWCLGRNGECAHITEYGPVKILGIRLPIIRQKDSYHAKYFIGKGYFEMPLGNMGGSFGLQMMRMLWHGFEARAKFHHGTKYTLEKTLECMLEYGLPAIYIAMSIFAVGNTAKSLSLKEMLYFAVYRSETFFMGEVTNIMKENNQNAKYDEVLSALEDIQGHIEASKGTAAA